MADAPKKRGTKSGAHQLTVDLPDDLFERLTAAADERGVPLKWLASRILHEAHLAPVETFALTTAPAPAPAPDPGVI